ADLRVGRLAVIDVAEASADADHRLGQPLLAEAPAGDVHLVDALVAEVAVAVVPDPVPVVVDGAVGRLAVRRVVRGGAAPQVVVHRGGRLLVTVHLADARPRLVAQAARQLHLADAAGLHEGDGVAHPGHAAALRAGLAE